MSAQREIKYQWQGEPVQVEFGFFHAKPDTERPLAWYNFECETSPNTYAADGSSAIEAIRVTYGDQVFCIANHFGIGAHKLRRGGWPTHQHFSFRAGRFDVHGVAKAAKRLNEPEFAAHEAAREAWMKKTDPVGYARIQELREAGRKLFTPPTP